MRVDLLAQDSASVGESPLYDPRDGRVYWVDLVNGVLSSLHADGSRDRRHLTEMLGAVGLSRNGGLVGIDRDGFGVICDDGFHSTDTIGISPRFRMNDAKVDSRGRFWGNRTEVEFAAAQGSLHVWDGAGPSAVVARGFGLPNGIGWSPDNSVMYLVDSTAHVVMAAPFDADDGAIGSFHTLAAVTRGMPDGLTVDADGCLWVASWGGGCVIRITPAGATDHVVEMPVSKPSSCAFADGTTLIVTSANLDLTPDQQRAEPLAGSVFAIDAGVTGLPPTYFGVIG